MEGAKFDFVLLWCRGINIASGSSSLLCLVAHAMSLVTGPHLFSLHDESLLQILRIYAILIAALLMLVETEWSFILDHARILGWYLGRSFLQGLLAVLTLELATSQQSSKLSDQTDFQRSIRLYRKASSYLMLGCALYYLLGGLVCIGALRRARYTRLYERQRLQKELEDLEKAAAETRGLLAVHNKETA